MGHAIGFNQHSVPTDRERSSRAVPASAICCSADLEPLPLPGSRRVRALIRTKLSSACTELIYVLWNTLGPFLVELLARRQRQAQSAYVFAGEGRGGFVIEPKRCVAKVIEESGITFTLHDLRRTFITVAESIGTPPYSLKRLVNHQVRGDVTQGYIVSDVERLREPMANIEVAPIV